MPPSRQSSPNPKLWSRVRGASGTTSASALAAFGPGLLFGFAFSWTGVCPGMVLRVEVAARSPAPAGPRGFRWIALQ